MLLRTCCLTATPPVCISIVSAVCNRPCAVHRQMCAVCAHRCRSCRNTRPPPQLEGHPQTTPPKRHTCTVPSSPRTRALSMHAPASHVRHSCSRRRRKSLRELGVSSRRWLERVRPFVMHRGRRIGQGPYWASVRDESEACEWLNTIIGKMWPVYDHPVCACAPPRPPHLSGACTTSAHLCRPLANPTRAV